MEFTKMQGLGNDFIILNQTATKTDCNWSEIAIKLCDRHLGIGADGLVLVLPSNTADLRMRIINSDGSEPEMCGNAIRCFAKYVYERAILTKTEFTVETRAGIIQPELLVAAGKVVAVKVNMGQPCLQRREIPMCGPESRVINEALWNGHEKYHITSLLMNVPHTIVFVDAVNQIDLPRLGQTIEKHPSFPQGTNVNFVEIVDAKTIKVRTWERGAGATLACGTGCCAAVVAGVLNRKTERSVTVHLPAGQLAIEWTPGGTVYMCGPAETVFTGTVSALLP